MPGKPLEVFGRLEYVGQDAEGKIHLLIQKDSIPQKTREIIKDIKKLENKDIRMMLSVLRWNNNAIPKR